MADIRRERCHGVVDNGAVLVPKLDAAADEGVTQVVDARLSVRAARCPTELGSELFEYAMDCPVRERPTRRREEEKRVSVDGTVARPHGAIAMQCCHDGHVHGDVS